MSASGRGQMLGTNFFAMLVQDTRKKRGINQTDSCTHRQYTLSLPQPNFSTLNERHENSDTSRDRTGNHVLRVSSVLDLFPLYVCVYRAKTIGNGTGVAHIHFSDSIFFELNISDYKSLHIRHRDAIT